MKQFDLATTAIAPAPLLDTGLLALATGAFFAVVLAYYLLSGYFQSERRGRFSGDGIAFLLSGVLFVGFTASYLEIFLVAFKLPFSAYQDLAIGLAAVSLAIGFAQGASHWLATRRAPSST